MHRIDVTIYTNDTAILGLLDDSSEIFDLFAGDIERFVLWCERHSLHLNVSKTKDMVIDFRLKGNEHDAIEIAGELVERVSYFKNLGVTVNDKLDCSVHVQNVMSKVNQNMYFVRQLNPFGVDSVLVSLFHCAVVQSIMSFCVILWGGTLVCKYVSQFDSVAWRVCRMTDIRQCCLTCTFYLQCVLKKKERIVFFVSKR